MKTLRTSSLEKSEREKYTHIPCIRGFKKSETFHIRIKKNRVSHILLLKKRGANHIPGSAEKGSFGTYIYTMPHIGTYRRLVWISYFRIRYAFYYSEHCMGLTGRLANCKIVISWARYDDLDQPAHKNVSRSC